MCDGQVTVMQDILRHQEHNISVSIILHLQINAFVQHVQIDIVSAVTELLQAVAENKKPNISVIEMTIQVNIFTFNFYLLFKYIGSY